MKFLIPALVLSACLPAAFSQEQIIPKPAEITVFHGKPAQLTPAKLIQINIMRLACSAQDGVYPKI